MKILFLQPDAVRREFEFIQEVSSFDELMDFFNSFDWEKGNKIIAQRVQIDLPCFPQTLRFQKSPTDYIELTPSRDNEEYTISCVKDKSVMEILVSGTIDRQPVSIKEFLEDFWSGNLKDKYNFGEINDSDNSDINVKSDLSIWLFYPFLLLLIGPMIVLSGKGSVHQNVNYVLIMTGVFCVVLLPYFIILLQYFKYNGGAALNISKKNKTLTLTRKDQSTTVFLKDITKARILFNDKRKSLTRGWGNLILEIGPQKRIVITTFLYKDLDRLAGLLQLNPISDTSIFPLISLRLKSDTDLSEEKSEFDLKVQEFMTNFSAKSQKELLQIKQNPKDYADYAVEAANRLLKK